MRQILIFALAVVLAGCGNRSATPEAAQKQADAISNVAIDAAKQTPGANLTLKTDAKGCKDKAKALDVIAASKLEDPSKMIKLISDGMKDYSCRGFIERLPVALDHREGDLACILPGDDPQNKQCFWIEGSAL